MNLEQTVLPSGLRVATERLPGVATATIAVTVAVGSRDETAEDQGISHLLEHMAFKGTATMNARQLAEAFDDIGGQNNAYTSAESTVYYAKVMAADAALATHILGDILTCSTFDEAELEKERGVILQEIAMHRDMPEEYAGDMFQETAFAGQPLGRSILGTEGHIEAFSRDDLMRYMKHGYTPEKMIVSAAGEVEHAAIVAAAQERFAGLESASPVAPAPARYTGGDWRETHDLEQAHLHLGFPACSIHHADYPALQLLNTILGGGISSRLFQEVREARGLAYHVHSFTNSYSDAGSLGIYTATGGHQLRELLPVIAGQMHDLAREVSDAELARARRQHLAGIAMARESTSSVAEWIGRHLLLYGEVRSLPVLKARLDAVSAADIARIAAGLLGGPLTVAAYGPVEDLPEASDIAALFA